MRLTNEQLRELLDRDAVRKRNPELSNPNHHPGKAPVMEPSIVNVALGAASVQKTDTRRFLVRVCSVRRRLLDEDNGCEKFLVDQLRYVGAIPDDNPQLTRIETTQRLCNEGEPEHVEMIVELI